MYGRSKQTCNNFVRMSTILVLVCFLFSVFANDVVRPQSDVNYGDLVFPSNEEERKNFPKPLRRSNSFPSYSYQSSRQRSNSQGNINYQRVPDPIVGGPNVISNSKEWNFDDDVKVMFW